jgi:outer membrane receptor protein involved in Fe transport
MTHDCERHPYPKPENEMKRYLLSGVFAVAAALAQANDAQSQTAHVTGVVQTPDALPIAGATVRLEGTAYGTLTDSRGGFRIAGLSAGSYAVVAEQLGYVAQTINVTLTDSAQLRFVLAESPVALSGVVVTASGAAERQLTATTSIGAVTGPELRELKASHPAEVLSRVAGAWVNVAGSGEGHMTSIRQPLTTAPVYLYLEDGVPTRSTGFFNHNALYEINVPQAGRVEVLKGPGTALYGSDAIGGVINVETRVPSLEPSAEFFAEAGGHGWNRMLASLSGSRGRNGLRFDANYTRWGGWRDETGYDRQSATLRWDHQFAGSASLKTVFAYSDIDQIDPSPLARPVFENDAEVNEFPIATRSIRALRFSSSLSAPLGASELTLTPFFRSNEMDIVPSWMLSFDPVTYQTGHNSAGVVARIQRPVPQLRGSFTVGADFDYSPGFREEYRINATREESIYTSYTRGDLIYDYDVTFVGTSPYVQFETRPFARLHIDAGMRYDHIAYDYDNKLDPLTTGPHRRPADAKVSFDQFSPKLGWSYDLGQGALFGSYRRSFRAPSEGQLFRQGSAANTIDLDPIRAESFELGARAVLGSVDFEITGYDMHVYDDVLTFVTETNLREAQNAGETRHRGLELAAGWNAASWLRFDASAAHAQHKYEHWQPRANLSYSGNEMAVAPRNLVTLRTRLAPQFLRGGFVSADYQRVGSYWEDPENTSKYEGHGLVNVRARVPVHGGVDVIVRATNVFDERYAENASFNAFEQERLTPGAPRMLYIGIQGRWPEIRP